MSAPYNLSDDNVVVIIGSGAGGATLGHELALKGVDIVCLEAGKRLTLADIVNDPPEMDKRIGWQDTRHGSPTWLCKTVGGTTMRWSAIALRFKDHEFTPLSSYGPKAGASIIDWPFGPDELAPYYDRAEAKMGVSGTGDIPPSPMTNNAMVLKAGGLNVGYKEFTTSHLAINPVERDGRAACQQVGFCYSGCAFGAKWSTLYSEIPKAEATGHFELRAESMVTKINHDASGRVTGVIYRDKDGVEHEQKARAVAIAGNVVETTRLLLNSASNLHPSGLGNASDHVGRHYMKHQHSTVGAIMPGPVNAHRGARQTGLIFDEWKHDTTRGFVAGYTIQAAFGPPALLVGNYGGWGKTFQTNMENYTNMAVGFACGEDLSRTNNRIYLHDTEKDINGLPVPVLTYAQGKNEKAMETHSLNAMETLYRSLGSETVSRTSGNGSTCHNMGTARMSLKPEDGATNPWGQVHDISNLFISDGSLFPSSGAANPTLTIVALAIRQAEHIAARLSSGTL